MILMPHKKYTCIALGLMISLSSSQLFAHSKLVSASPAAESTIAKSPKQITISFNEKTVLKKIELHDANHNVIPLKFKPRMRHHNTIRSTSLPLKMALITYIGS
ncbi:hypothetical protein F945_01639 [Acinetobacter rudis CIP 110305]|uniref:CopC domain-containing protein n=1 Tax=Acinetobacter rudis CIP 110305 TaxID=421052 RepID=S3N3E6_9GAMM|nr:hypothetical protein F945_01639 [Acinetobacter rudis CIP 110305]